MNSSRGLIDAADRSLEELLSRPVFKDSLRSIIKNIDPESARRLVNTIMWKDQEVLLALLGSLPLIANTIITALDELLAQVNQKFPPELLKGFAESILADIDIDKLSSVTSRFQDLKNELSPVLDKALKGKSKDKGD